MDFLKSKYMNGFGNPNLLRNLLNSMEWQESNFIQHPIMGFSPKRDSLPLAVVVCRNYGFQDGQEVSDDMMLCWDEFGNKGFIGIDEN